MTSVVDLFGLATLIPVLSVLSDKSVLEGDGKLAMLKEYSGIENSNNFLLALFLGSFIFMLLRSLFIIYSHWRQTRFTYIVGEYIGKKMYRYYLSLDYESFSNKDSAQILRELTSNSQQFSSFLVSPLLLINTELIVLIFIVAGIAFYNIQVFFILLVTILPMAFIFQRAVKKKVQRYGAEKNKFLFEFLTASNRASNGYVDVKLRSKEKVLIDSYMKSYKDMNFINVRTKVLSVIPAKLFELSAVAGLVIIFVYGAFIAENSSSIFQLIMIYAAAGYRIIPSLGKLTPSMMFLDQYQFLFEIFEEPLSYSEDEDDESFEIQRKPMDFNNKIQIQELDFQYNNANETTLQDINLTIEKGEIVGLIGRSGSGKTTLVKLLAGLLIPNKGSIKIDDQVLSKESTSSWMQLISYVQQSPYLEKGNLAENIAFLDDKIDEDRLVAAIKNASLKSLIGESDPFEFQVEENGKNLSGGQKQRVIIARALYHNAQFIILDEATSALDNETEAEINETVAKLKGTGVTVIIIAHRITTLKYTDRIVEMENGSINKELVYSEIANSGLNDN
jgi:ABC-type multidrug transport system fused ATPase/permease subunit